MAERSWGMKVHGLKELEKIMLETFPNKVNRRILLAALRKSAQPMKETAKMLVARRSGALAESVGLKTIRNRGNNKEFASIALAPMRGNLTAWMMYKNFYKRGVSSDGYVSLKSAKAAGIRHGHLIEFGFRQHPDKGGKQIPPNPWLRPAFDMNANGMVSTFRQDLKKKIEAAAKAIYKKNQAALRMKR